MSAQATAAAAAAVPVAAPVAPAPPMPAASEPVKPLPGAENAGKPGYYTVRQGDTMIKIGLESGQAWRDLVRWNSLENPDLIEVGQVIRVVPPTADPSVAAARPVTPSKVETKPLDAKPTIAAASSPSASSPPVIVPVPLPPPPSPAMPPVARNDGAGDDGPAWTWPASGPVLTPFEEGRSKGLVLSGKAGDPVFAAADGRVVYAGSGLRGYGNLVIVKHNATYLSAYAHNQTLLVKEDQNVKRGQKIAEMGATDADRVQLHFEIRKLGKPVDPTKLLPAR